MEDLTNLWRGSQQKGWTGDLKATRPPLNLAQKAISAKQEAASFRPEERKRDCPSLLLLLLLLHSAALVLSPTFNPAYDGRKKDVRSVIKRVG